MLDLALAILAFLAFSHLVTEVASVLRARASGRDCPCRAVGSLTIEPGTFVPAPRGTLVPGTPEDAARKVH